MSISAERLTDDELESNPRAMVAEADNARLRALVAELAGALERIADIPRFPVRDSAGNAANLDTAISFARAALAKAKEVAP